MPAAAVKRYFSDGVLAGVADSGFYLLAVVVGRGAQLLAIPLLVRELAPGDFAVFDLMLVGITLAAAALLFGTDSSVAADYAQCAPDDRSAQHALFRASCAVPLMLAVPAALLLAGAQAAGWLGGAMAATWWTGATCALMLSLNNCVIALLRWTMRARRAALLIALVGALPVAGSLGVFATGGTPTLAALQAGLFAGYALATAVCFGCAAASLRKHARSGVRPGAAALLRRSWPMGLASLALPARRGAERFMVLLLLGESALAAFALLARIAQVLEIVLQALGNGLYPRALRSLAEPAGQRLARQTAWLFWLVSGVGIAVCALAPQFVVRWVAGANYLAHAPLLAASVAVASLSALPYCLGMSFFHAQRLRRYALALVGTAVFSIAGAGAGAWLFGTLAAWLFGALLASALGALAFVGLSERLHRVGYALPATGLILCALAAMAAASAVTGTHAWHP
jgi:O-antigen/teichoic acid export membrane protein